jgi:serine protease Do
VKPGVVNISTVNRSGAAPRSLGSGILITPDGFVVTNNHVIQRAETIQVRVADGRELPADIVGREPSTDVALLRLRTSATDLPHAYLGDSDQLEVGDWVVAIGNPFGLDHSVAHGLISAKERVIGIGAFDDFLQTDALINPGNSGGPLFNMRGEVVGVNTAIMSQGQGIGFAVPINMVKELLPHLRERGRLTRGWLGVTVEEGRSAAAKGAVITRVLKNGPAFAGGLQPGDRVVAVNGHVIETYPQLLRRVSFLAPGSEVRLSYVRDGSTHEVVTRLGERPAEGSLDAMAQQKDDPLGIAVKDVTAELGQQLGVAAGSGAFISAVIPGSAAERDGLRAGDVIIEVNRRRVTDVKTYRSAIATTTGVTLVRYRRDDVVQYVAIKP